MRSDPCGAAAPSQAVQLRVASYNIHRAVGSDRRRDPARIAAVIGDLDADIIGLQEVDWHHETDVDASQFEYLAHLPGYRAVAGPNIRDHRGHYGNMLLTAAPVLAVRRIDLSLPDLEPRGAIDVDLDLGSAGLRIIVTHFGRSVRERWWQARQLRSTLLDRPARPTLLLGDFNEWLPASPTLRPLLKLCERSKTPRSFPAVCPLFGLDRVLAFRHHPPLDVHCYSSPIARLASDHLPVVAATQLR